MPLFERYRPADDGEPAPPLREFLIRPAVPADVTELSRIEADREGGEPAEYAARDDLRNGPAHTQAKRVVHVAGDRAAANRRPAIPSVGVPTAAALETVGAGRGTGRIGRVAIAPVPVPAPLPHVAVHLAQTPPVRGKASDRHRRLPVLPRAAAFVRLTTIGVGLHR